MAQTTLTGAYTDSTSRSIYAGPGRVTSITVALNVAQTTAFLQLWDATAPTPGTDDTTICIALPTVAIQGAYGMKTFKVIFPGGGIRFGTGISAFVGGGAESGTAVLTTALPQSVRVDYARGN